VWVPAGRRKRRHHHRLPCPLSLPLSSVLRGAPKGRCWTDKMQGQAQMVAQLLSQTGNCDDGVRAAAESKLKAFSAKTGFRSCLLDIALHRGAPDQIRLCAIINLKNFVSNAGGIRARAFRDEALNLMRRLATVATGDPAALPNPIFFQMSRSVTNLALSPWRNWEELFGMINNALMEKNNIQRLHRAASLCEEVLEAMLCTPLTCRRAHVVIIAGQIAGAMVSAWKLSMQRVLDATKRLIRLPNSSPNRPQALDSIRRLCSCAAKLSKGLSWSLVKGSMQTPSLSNSTRSDRDSKMMREDNSSSSGVRLRGLCPKDRLKGFTTIIDGFEVLVQAIASIGPRHSLSDDLIGLANSITELICKGHGSHAAILSGCIHKAARAHRNIITLKQKSAESDEMKQLRSRGLYFLTELLMGHTDDAKYCASVEKVYDLATVRNLVQFVVSNYLVPTRSDLEEWAEDPESYFVQTSAQAMGRHLHPRPCAEGFLCILCIRYEAHVLPLLAKMIAHVSASFPPSHLANLSAGKPAPSGSSAAQLLTSPPP